MVHIAFCLSIGFVCFHRKVFFCLFFDFCLCFHISFIVIISLYNLTYFCDAIFVFTYYCGHCSRKIPSSLSEVDYLFVLLLLQLQFFISHIICTHAHNAEADHIVDSEPDWRCRGDAAG